MGALSLRCERSICKVAVTLTLAVALVSPALAINRSWNTADGLWGVAGNWSPVGVPVAGDGVLIGNTVAANNDVVTLNSSTTIASLALTDGMRLDTNSRALTVSGATLVSGLNIVGNVYYRSTLRIESVDGTSFMGEDLQIEDFGRVWLDYAYASVDDLVSIDPNCFLSGEGGLSLFGNGARALINDGYIDPYVHGLTIWQLGAGLIDLDGNTGNGEVLLTTAGADPNSFDRLTIFGSTLNDPFDGVIKMRNGALLEMDLAEGWTLGTGGLIDKANLAGADAFARIAGGHFTIAGAVDVNGSTGALRIEAPATVNSTAQFELSPGSELEFTGDTTVEGGTFNVGADGQVRMNGPTDWRGAASFTGLLQQNGDALVSAPTTINAELFDFSGAGDQTAWDIESALTMNVEDTRTSPFDFYDGEMNISGLFGRLTLNLVGDVQSAWVMEGTLNLLGPPAFFQTRVAGSTMLLGGSLNISNARAEITADVFALPGSIVSFTTPASELRMRGKSYIREGSSWLGEGTLRNGVGGEMRLYHTVSLGDVGLVNQGVLRHYRYGAPDELAAVSSVRQFTNDANGAWHVRISGNLPGEDHDLLIVSPGAASLAGSLVIEQLANPDVPFSPQIGDEFVILTALGGVSGTFQNAAPVSCADGVRYQWTVIYGTNDVRVRLDGINPSYPGDMNCDCRVDFFDIDILVEALSYPGGADWPHDCPWLNGDCDSDGDVDFFDIDPFVALIGS